MSARLLLLCPGQGGQHAGMNDLARSDPRARTLLDQCAPLPADPARLHENGVAQPAIVAATLAMWEALRDDAPAPALVAGYSVGALAAYSVAGALAPRDAVALAQRRACLMDAAAARSGAQALVALAGLALAHLRATATAQGFHIAIVTGADHCIVGGLAQSLPALEAAIAAQGGKSRRLPVDVASHTLLMASAVQPFAEALHAVPLQHPSCPVLTGVAPGRLTGREMIADQLARQLAETMHWDDCMDGAFEAGVTVALELGPGSALAHMLQRRHRTIDCRSVADFRTLAGVTAWLARHAD